MRRVLIAAVIGIVGLLAGCSSGFDAFAAAGASPDHVPAYETLGEDVGSGRLFDTVGAELVVAEATVATARAAIADYVSARTEHDYVEATVIRSADAGTIVCTGRYVADERVAAARTDIEADSYPALDMNCPDPS